MRTILCLALVALCGCGNMTATTRTFTHLSDGAPLVLKVTRHMDTIFNGPDIDEDQVLILELQNYRLKVPVTLPSDAVKVRFAATRFGPPAKGEEFHGTIVIKTVTTNEVTATLNISLIARTAGGASPQKWWFRGDYKFVPEKQSD